jgi:hypothetical protein
MPLVDGAVGVVSVDVGATPAASVDELLLVVEFPLVEAALPVFVVAPWFTAVVAVVVVP